MTTVLPSDSSLNLELMSLSMFLYDCIGQAGVLGPTREEYDNLRNEKWARSRYLLRVFGWTENGAGWDRLLNAYGFFSPTVSDVRKAAYRRLMEQSFKGYELPVEDDYPELPGYWREYVEYEDLGFGRVLRTTRRIFQPT